MKPLNRLIMLALGASSVGSLLIYFQGWLTLPQATLVTLLPALILGGGLLARQLRQPPSHVTRLALRGLWAGALATLTYDVVRVPIAQSGIPVFKAISYFGMLLAGANSPSLTSEILGWTYHASNGIGFGLMYVAAVPRPKLWSAILWGLVLEGIMLLTPYAEVFGYKIGPQFLAITIGAHIVYGTTLWWGLREWPEVGAQNQSEGRRKVLTPAQRWGLLTLVPLGISLIGALFHARYADRLKAAPPPSLGPHLYVTWNVFEVDRLMSMWALKRFVDPQAEFYFIEPFSRSRIGTPFDMPEGKYRRIGNSTAFEIVLRDARRPLPPATSELIEIARLFELEPWQLPRYPARKALGDRLLTSSIKRGSQSRFSDIEDHTFAILDSTVVR